MLNQTQKLKLISYKPYLIVLFISSVIAIFGYFIMQSGILSTLPQIIPWLRPDPCEFSPAGVRCAMVNANEIYFRLIWFLSLIMIIIDILILFIIFVINLMRSKSVTNA